MITGCSDCNRFGHWGWRSDMSRKRTQSGRSVICPLSRCPPMSLLVYPELSIEHKLRGAGADTCCNRTVAGQEWMNENVKSLEARGFCFLARMMIRTFQNLLLGSSYGATKCILFQFPFMESTVSCEPRLFLGICCCILKHSETRI